MFFIFTGFSTFLCSDESEECNLCESRGRACHYDVDGHSCICPPNYREVKCLPMKLISCSNPKTPCENGGICEHQNGDPHCRCRPDYYGKRCEFFSKSLDTMMVRMKKIQYEEIRNINPFVHFKFFDIIRIYLLLQI